MQFDITTSEAGKNNLKVSQDTLIKHLQTLTPDEIDSYVEDAEDLKPLLCAIIKLLVYGNQNAHT